MKHLPNKQQGFTLLELLVVITLLAVLSVGALVAYEGVGENAQATAAANNAVTLDRAIRNYRAVTSEYPDQWDSLVKSSDGTVTAANLANETDAFVVSMDITAPAASTANIRAALEDAGIEEIQYSDALTPGVAPNLAHNEGANGAANAPQREVVDTDGNAANDLQYISILPMGASCNVQGGTVGAFSTALDTTAYTNATAANFQSIINDELGEAGEGNGCNLIVAVGFGHDAAHSTTDSSVAIAQAPTYTSAKINPANNYARYIGLFLIGSDDDVTGTTTGTGGVNVVDADEMRDKAKLIAVITPEGKTVDESLLAANTAN